MKLYKLPGSDEFVSWDVLHNEQGYSLDATNPVTWLSAGTVAHEWGETVAGGYMEPTEDDGWSTNGFCHGKNGWHNMDDMANILYVWPNIATSTKAWHNSLGESNVAVWEYGENSLYLVQKELQEGWMDEETFAERGWEIVDDTPYEFVFVDSTTGRVTSGVEHLNEMEFVETGYFTIEDAEDVVFVEPSAYPIVCEYSLFHNESVAADSGITTTLPYYSQKLYTCCMSTIPGGQQSAGWEIANDNGLVRVINRTGSSVTVVVVMIRFIDATDAQVVEVEKILTGFRASAFKYTASGTDYYFIPWAEYEAGWVDDLSSIGWQEVPVGPVLPTVSDLTVYTHSCKPNRDSVF